MTGTKGYGWMKCICVGILNEMTDYLRLEKTRTGVDPLSRRK